MAGDIDPVTVNIANRIVPAAGNIAATAADAIPTVTVIIATTLFVRQPKHECAFYSSGRRKHS